MNFGIALSQLPQAPLKKMNQQRVRNINEIDMHMCIRYVRDNFTYTMTVKPWIHAWRHGFTVLTTRGQVFTTKCSFHGQMQFSRPDVCFHGQRAFPAKCSMFFSRPRAGQHDQTRFSRRSVPSSSKTFYLRKPTLNKEKPFKKTLYLKGFSLKGFF